MFGTAEHNVQRHRKGNGKVVVEMGENMEKYSACKFCDEKEITLGFGVRCKKFDQPLLIGQLSSWESDYYQLPECKKKSGG